MTAEQDALLDVLADIFPIYPEDFDTLTSYVVLEYVTGEDAWSTHFEPSGALRLTLRLLVWDRHNDAPTIRDVKEQQVYVGAEQLTDTARAEAFFRAWAEVLTRALAATAKVDASVPDDLFFPDVLTLKRPQTQDQFIDALTAKNRLGRYL